MKRRILPSFRETSTDVRRRRTLTLVGAGFFVGATLGLVFGCATPTFSTDNKFLLYLPGAARKSDQIPGVTRPWERVQLIREKGVKGQKATPEDKDELLLQLAREYETSDSPHIRRASLDAIARISNNYRNPVAEKIYRSALEDADLNLALSSCDAWGDYCRELSLGKDAEKNAGEKNEARRLGAEFLSDKYKRLPFSIAAGSEEENKKKKDLRVAILRNLGKFQPDDSPSVLETLEYGIDGEKLDDGALQDAAMTALERVTGKKYGLNAENWLAYLAFERGEASEAPKELSLTERMPKLETGIFK